jgi:hypothetical protein
VRKNKVLLALLAIIFGVGFCIFMSSCGYLLYDLIEGGDSKSSEKYSINVNLWYSGSYPVGTAEPMYSIVYGFYFEGFEPDLVYVSDPITSSYGSHSFSELEKMSYGILVFIDLDGNYMPSYGDIYQFYNNTDYDPDEIYLNSDKDFDIFLYDSYTWTEITENFDDGVADNWNHDGYGRWSIDFIGGQDGEYQMNWLNLGDWGYSYYNRNFDNFSYSADIVQLSGDTQSLRGLLFRSPTPDEINNIFTFVGYLLLITSDGGWCLERYNGGGFSRINSYGDIEPSPYLYTGMGSSNRVRVDCFNSTIDISFNDNHVEKITDSTSLSGSVGLVGYDHASFNNAFHFDNVLISEF